MQVMKAKNIFAEEIQSNKKSYFLFSLFIIILRRSVKQPI